MIENNENAPLFELIKRAESWLGENAIENRIIKWDTRSWGENPADFGRK
jgi:ribonuclease HI